MSKYGNTKQFIDEDVDCLLIVIDNFTKETRYVPIVDDQDLINWFKSKMKCVGIYRPKK